jgi:hypothetical protein
MWIADRLPVKTIITPSSETFGYQTDNENKVVPASDLHNEQGKYYIGSWDSCREAFLPKQEVLKSFFFAHDLEQGRGRSIAEFFNKIEIKLGIKSIRRTKIQATSKRLIVKVTPAKIWTKNKVNRSLFTALLRASLAYRISEENFEEALFSTGYTKSTRWAIRRFLSGATVYTGDIDNFHGWVSAFEYATRKQIDALLVRPKKKTPVQQSAIAA